MKRPNETGAALLVVLIVGSLIAIVVPIALQSFRQGLRNAQMAQLPGVRADVLRYVEASLDCAKTVSDIPAACTDDRVPIRNAGNTEISIDGAHGALTLRARCTAVTGGTMRLSLDYGRKDRWHLFKEQHECPYPAAP